MSEEKMPNSPERMLQEYFNNAEPWLLHEFRNNAAVHAILERCAHVGLPPQDAYLKLAQQFITYHTEMANEMIDRFRMVGPITGTVIASAPAQ
jgi:hypothetical protein